MNELKSPIFVADNEVHFLCPWIGFVVVNITEIICAASEKFDVYHIFQSPAYVLFSHRVLSVVLESRVYDICFRISDTILTFKGVFGENLDEECLTEKVCVFFAGLVIDTEDSGHVVVVNFLACVVDQMVGNLSEGIDITDFEAAFDVFLQDGADEALDIPTLVPNTMKALLRDASAFVEMPAVYI